MKQVTCPNCGCFIATEEYYKSFWHWEDECRYYYITSKGRCDRCDIAYDDGEFEIPDYLKPTQKQINAVTFIKSRLDVPDEEGITKESYRKFISKYFDKAKHTEPPMDGEALDDPTYVDGIVDCYDLGISPWGHS